MIDFFAESDNVRKDFEGDWSRSSKRIDLLNGFIVEDLKRINPLLNILTEEVIEYIFYTKKHDIVIGDNRHIVLETKFIEKDYEKNDNNYFEGEVGRSTIAERNGKEYFSLICIRKSATKGDFQNTKERCRGYGYYLKNVCVLYYNDETKEYTLLVGDDYDTFLNKIVNGANT